eukprot:6968490-Prymnesium_polylepis.1
MALSEAAKECVYLARFLENLGFSSDEATALATDNSAARDLSYNPEHHDKVKHVERRHFYVRELVEDHLITVPYVSTHDNMADFFTKPLCASAFYPLRDAIMNWESSRVYPAPGARSAGGCGKVDIQEAPLVPSGVPLMRSGDSLCISPEDSPPTGSRGDLPVADATCATGGVNNSVLVGQEMRA